MGLVLTRRALQRLYNLAFAHGKDPSEMLVWLIEQAADDWERRRGAGHLGAGDDGKEMGEQPHLDGGGEND